MRKSTQKREITKQASEVRVERGAGGRRGRCWGRRGALFAFFFRFLLVCATLSFGDVVVPVGACGAQRCIVVSIKRALLAAAFFYE